jgi:hypothetical protein
MSSVATTDARRLAVVIDSDNATASVTTELLAEIAKCGTATIKRAYLSSDDPCASPLALVPRSISD